MCRQGGSSKHYFISIQRRASGFYNLYTAYGGIGFTPRNGKSYPAFSTEKAAITAAYKLINEKMAKGYVLTDNAAINNPVPEWFKICTANPTRKEPTPRMVRRKAAWDF